MAKQILTKVKAYDHYTTFQTDIEDQAKECFLYFRGEIIGEDDVYLHVASRQAVFHYPNGAIESGGEPYIHRIIKSTIVKRVDVEIEWDEEQ